MFKAWWITKDEGLYKAEFAELDESRLPEGDVTVRVAYSSMNYKDALALTGKAPVVRQFPMIPGVDLAGVVTESSSAAFAPGASVLLTGWGVGELHWGGLAELARLRSEWLTPLPAAFTARQAMSIGTAGLTAAQAVLALLRHGLKPTDGEVLVTGANGGVGGFAISILSALGYTVVASTGRPEQGERLRALGASEILDRALLSAPGKPLGRERWAGAVDTVGSHTLANVCATLRRGGAVAACGMAQGIDFPASVAPFILRDVALLGVDSVLAPKERRERAWALLAQTLDGARAESLAQVRPLAQALDCARELIAGQVRGRIVIEVGG